MNHIEFWQNRSKRTGCGAGWTVYENGTLVHPLQSDRAENERVEAWRLTSADDILKLLNDSLGGGSGAGSPYGDIYFRDEGDGYFTISFAECVGGVLAYCHVSELGDTEGDDETTLGHKAGMLCRKKRNLDAAGRVKLHLQQNAPLKMADVRLLEGMSVCLPCPECGSPFVYQDRMPLRTDPIIAAGSKWPDGTPLKESDFVGGPCKACGHVVTPNDYQPSNYRYISKENQHG